LELLRVASSKHGLSESECALRWLVHHSNLEAEKGDAVIVGASSVEHLEANLSDLEKESLPKDVTDALDAGWEMCKAVSSNYWH
jgi:aflatoxin B1 aldehyde reductase